MSEFSNFFSILFVFLFLGMSCGGILHPGRVELRKGVVQYSNSEEGDIDSNLVRGNNWTVQIIDDKASKWTGTSVALDSNALVHLSYYDIMNGSIKYADYDGEGCHIYTVDMINVEYGERDISLCVDNNDFPHISYFNGNPANDLKYTHYDGNQWQKETVDIQGNVGRHNSLALDTNNRPHVCYIDETNWQNKRLKYAHYDGNQWQIETVDNQTNVDGNVSLELDSNDRPCVSYYNSSLQGLKYAHYDGNQWQTETIDSGEYMGNWNSLALDTNDRPHISYYNGSNSDLKYTYHDGNQWHIETVDSEGFLGGSSIAMDSNNHPHIAYSDFTNLDLKYAYHDGNQWIIEIVDSPGNVGQCSSIIIDADGRSHISYRDYPSPGLNANLKYAVRKSHIDDDPPQNEWTSQSIDTASPFPVSLDLDMNNRPHMGYVEGGLIYSYYDGAQWQIDTLSNDGSVSDNSSMALDSSGHPHFSCHNWDSDNLGHEDLKYAYHDGVQWHTEIVDSSDGAVGADSSIKTDVNDSPHISYFDWEDEDLEYAYHDGVQWHIETVESDGRVGEYSSLDLDSHDRPHISYYDTGNGALKYAYYDGAQWHIETVDAQARSGRSTSIILDSNDRPHIGYGDKFNNVFSLKYAHYDGNQWLFETLDSLITNLNSISIELDSFDRPHIGYWNAGLKYIYYDREQWHMETVDSHANVNLFVSLAIDDFCRPHVGYNNYGGIKYATRKAIPYNGSLTTSVDPIIPYWHDEAPFNITVTANYNISAVRDISLWYRFSSDNGSFNDWSPYALDTSSPWSFSFDAPDGAGYYEFHSIANDTEGNRELPPVFGDAACGLDNTDPVADAGPDMAVDQRTIVLLNGSASSDNIEIVEYMWEFGYDEIERVIYGPLSYFLFEAAGTYTVILMVRDVAGNSATDSVVIRVNDVGLPVADAGSDMAVDQGDTVTFNGSGSSDDTGIENYSWRFIDDGVKILHGAAPSYRFHRAGSFFVILNVTDAAGNMDSDTMTVTVRDITEPVADAGPDLVVDQEASITLDGRRSYDDIGIVDYTWSFIYDDENIILHGRTSVFTFRIVGEYEIELNVTDTNGNWGTDIFIITVRDTSPPVADAGADITAHVDEKIIFNASGSFDNVAIVNYTWLLFQSDITVLRGKGPSFVFGSLGTYTVTLIVADAAGNTAKDNVTVNILGEDGGENETGELDSDGDGYNDTYENESGSDPYNPDSTPSDWDGDGVPNEEDAYPYDADRWAREKDKNNVGLIVLLILGSVFVILLVGTLCYTRIRGERVMENGNRKVILNYILEHPGEHYRELNRHLDVSRGTLTYHLRKLEDENFIVVKKEGKFAYVYPADFIFQTHSMTPAEKEIVKIIEEKPGLSLVELSEKTGKSPRTVHHHLSNLTAKNIACSKKVNGRSGCFLVTPVDKASR